MTDMKDRWDGFKMTVSEPTRARHMAAIGSALAESPAPMRRRIALAVATLMAFGVPTTAFASESAVPGDLLYPVKLALEPIRGVVDDDIAAVHRLAELEVMMERGADSEAMALQLVEARRVVEETGDPGYLSDLEALEARVRSRHQFGDDGDGQQAPESTPGSTYGVGSEDETQTDAERQRDRDRDSQDDMTTPSTSTDGRSGEMADPSPSTSPTTSMPQSSSPSSSMADPGSGGSDGSGGSGSSPSPGPGSMQKP